jgi:tripartite-type tricarboxylate transporter receptor subunit TctC
MKLPHLSRPVVQFAALGLAAAVIHSASVPAQAPAWPTKPVHIVVPFPAGGTTDIIGRTVGDELSKSLGQPVVIDNKPGANTNIGAAFVARAAPDGYTLLVASPSVTTNPGLYRALDYDTARDLTGVSLITEVPLVMVIHPAIPATSVAELVAHVKASGKPLSCGSTGSGSLAHLSCILLKNSTGMDVLHIPYKGGAPMVNDLLGGQVDTMFDAPATTLAHIQAGKMRALATTGPRRIPALPSLPTMKESGYDSFEVVWWAGVLAPAGTPAPIIERLNGDVARALDSPALAARFAPLGMGATKESAESFTARIKNDIVRWGKVFRDAGVTID